MNADELNVLAADVLRAHENYVPHDQWKTDLAWLEEDDPVQGIKGVTDDIQRIVDRTILEFEAEMRAEGDGEWLRRMREEQRPLRAQIIPDDVVLERLRADG